MSGLAVDAQVHSEDPLLPDAQGVEPTVAELDQVAAPLVHHEVAAHLVSMLVAEPEGAVLTAGLLIGGDHQEEVAPTGSPVAVTPAPPRPHPHRPPRPPI